MYNFFKNFIIAFLVVLAVYQTNKLWFEDFSSHNFFYTVLHEGLGERQSEDIKSEIEYAAVSSGTGRFFLSFDSEKNAEIKQAVVKAAKTALSKGSETEYSRFEIENIMKNRCAVVHFGFLLGSEEFFALYGGSSGTDMPAFDSVAAADGSAGGLKILFFDSGSLEGAAFELESYSDISVIRGLIDKAQTETEEIYYVSSVASNYDVFEGNEFIPTWLGEMYFYTVARTCPIGDEEGGTVIDRFVSSYFDNPVLKWTSVDEGVYTFSDENTVVKIYPNDVMEYSSYSLSGGGKDVDLGEKLLAAENFLDYEPNLNNSYYLAGYKADGDRTIFYFDYNINGYVLGLSEEMKEETGMESFIEVTVDGSRVSRYKRYLRDYSTTIKDPVYTEKSFLEVIDKGLNELQGESIESLRLEYLDMGLDGTPLCYYAEIDGKKYVETAF